MPGLISRMTALGRGEVALLGRCRRRCHRRRANAAVSCGASTVVVEQRQRRLGPSRWRVDELRTVATVRRGDVAVEDHDVAESRANAAAPHARRRRARAASRWQRIRDLRRRRAVAAESVSLADPGARSSASCPTTTATRSGRARGGVEHPEDERLAGDGVQHLRAARDRMRVPAGRRRGRSRRAGATGLFMSRPRLYTDCVAFFDREKGRG